MPSISGSNQLYMSATSWLRLVENDLKPLNIGLKSDWRKASDRAHWNEAVDMAMLLAVGLRK